jgi:hypothetical protein
MVTGNGSATMKISISPSMQKTILNHVQAVREEGSVLDVHKAAEAIRLLHIEDNVALEDIVEALVLTAGSNVPIELGSPARQLTGVDALT